MRTRTVALWLTLLMTLPSSIWPQTTPADDQSSAWSRPDWSVTLGVGSIVGPRFGYMGSDDIQVLPLPYVDIRWRDRFFLSTLEGAGVNAIAARRARVGFALHVDPGRQESDGDLLRGMGDVDLAPVARAFAGYFIGPIRLDAAFTRRLGEGEGALVELAPSYGWIASQRVRLIFTPSVTWMDDDYARTFFGVSTQQATRSGLPAYDVGSGVRDVALATAVAYQIDQRWGVLTQLRVSRLLGDAADSPVVAEELQPSVGTFLIYRF